MASAEEIITYLFLSFSRMVAAYAISLFLAFTLGYAMYRWRFFNAFLFPIIDFLQSVPILSFFPVALLIFIETFPTLGPELAVVFLITTSMVWNLIFAVYESLLSFPKKWKDLSVIFGVDLYSFVGRLYLPHAMPSLISNSMVSWANGWYFLIATEIITIQGKQFEVAGIGSFLLKAASSLAWGDVLLALSLLTILILLMNRLLWKPLMERRRLHFPLPPLRSLLREAMPSLSVLFKILSFLISAVISVAMLSFLAFLLSQAVEALPHLLTVLKDFLLSYARIWVAYLLSLAWVVPFVLLIYYFPKLEGLMRVFEVIASIPLPALFPFLLLLTIQGVGIEVASILFLMTGMQWYILFNLYGALKSIPPSVERLREAFSLPHFLFLRKVLLRPLLSLFIVGSLAAFGGGWNAVILAEHVEVGDQLYYVEGIGHLMMEALKEDSFALLSLATLAVGLLVPITNSLLWKPLLRRYAHMGREL